MPEPAITDVTIAAAFDAWFARLQKLTEKILVPEDWTERWFDGYSPAEALDAGPEE